MGGDDKDYLLKNLVCCDCNTQVFSPLEAQLMRNSPFAMGRLQFQPTGRTRGNKAKPPEFNPSRCVVVDDNGVISEAHITAGFKTLILPQLQIFNNNIEIGGSNNHEINSFINELKISLGSSVSVIVKRSNEIDIYYEVSKYEWNGHDYIKTNDDVYPKPPKGIWFENLGNNQDLNDGHPRLFKRLKGQIVIKLSRTAEISDFLSKVRRTLPQISEDSQRKEKELKNPLVNVGMKVEITKVFRAIAKIGVNFACHEYGDNTVRQASFRTIKEYILRGVGDSPVIDIPEIKELLSQEKRKIHLAILYPQIIGSQNFLLFILQIYGGGVLLINLTNDFQQSLIFEPVVYEIDYSNNKVNRSLLHEYLHTLINQSH